MTSRGFENETEAESEIRNLGGIIPTGHPMYLAFFDEEFETVWCWKDERTGGSSQIFESEQQALEAWNAERVVFDVLLD